MAGIDKYKRIAAILDFLSEGNPHPESFENFVIASIEMNAIAMTKVRIPSDTPMNKAKDAAIQFRDIGKHVVNQMEYLRANIPSDLRGNSAEKPK